MTNRFSHEEKSLSPPTRTMGKSAALAKQNLTLHIEEARENALKSLASYKFFMFGYWAAIWIHLNRLLDKPQPNPFRDLVKLAREMRNK